MARRPGPARVGAAAGQPGAIEWGMDNAVVASREPAVTFWGAAQAVTGSMHLVEAGGHRILLDCGTVRGRRHEERTPQFPFDPRTLTAVVLSHAHLDHSGNLPALVKQGFRGPIYCTPATRDLITVLLADSARFHEEESRVEQIVSGTAEGNGRHGRVEARQVVEQSVPVGYGGPVDVAPGVRLELSDAGHILGSAIVALRLACEGREASLTFTGDIGRRGVPFLREPAPLPPADLVLSESTYGGRVHQSLEETAGALEAVVWRSFEQGGKVLIPTFSLGRMQLVVQYLHTWIRDGRLPHQPIYVDSPLAADLVEVYRRHLGGLDPRVARSLHEDPGFLGGAGVEYVRTPEESKALSERRGPCIIVASGGMCDGGRILRHLKDNLDDPRCSVVMVNYQAPHTLGRKLLEPRPRVRFHGRDWNLWADVVEVSGFSGHADRNDLLAYLRPQAGRARRVRLVHGDPEQSDALAESLRAEGFADVGVPAPGESVNLL
jgi:metallo-beta-lactamase family protein